MLSNLSNIPSKIATPKNLWTTRKPQKNHSKKVQVGLQEQLNLHPTSIIKIQSLIFLYSIIAKILLTLENVVSIFAIEELSFLIGFVNNCPYMITANRVPS